MDTGKKIEKTDALRNPIIIGNKYGYSKNSSGYTHVVIGIAVRETKKGISLEVISTHNALYDDPLEDSTADSAKTTNVKSVCLFPVAETDADVVIRDVIRDNEQ